MGLAESVKVEKIGNTHAGGGAIEQNRIDWGIGRKRIAILLSIRFIVDALATPAIYWKWLLYRKSEATLTSLAMSSVKEKSDAIIGGGGHYLSAVGHVPMVEDFVFPYPVVLLRPSQLLVQSDGAIGYGAYLYYLTRKISDDDLARLMVKDHG